MTSGRSLTASRRRGPWLPRGQSDNDSQALAPQQHPAVYSRDGGAPHRARSARPTVERQPGRSPRDVAGVSQCGAAPSRTTRLFDCGTCGDSAEVSPGKRPITLVRRRTSTNVRSRRCRTVRSVPRPPRAVKDVPVQPGALREPQAALDAASVSGVLARLRRPYRDGDFDRRVVAKHPIARRSRTTQLPHTRTCGTAQG